MSELNAIFNMSSPWCFIGEKIADDEIAFPDKLPRDQLDWSLDSLHKVDAYLASVHKKRRRLSMSEWNATLLRAGAYVGEVIRLAAPKGMYNWIDYNDYVKIDPDIQELIPERTTATCAFLRNAKRQSTIMPINKIARAIDEGPENSVHWFAACEFQNFK